MQEVLLINHGFPLNLQRLHMLMSVIFGQIPVAQMIFDVCKERNY